MAIPTLAETQTILWQLLTAAEGVGAGLARLEPSAQARASALVHGDERLSAVDRLDVYANMYFYRLRDCLQEDFAVLYAVVGETNFHNLITDYLLVHPPAHFSLRYAGQHLPAFVRTHALAERWPYLSDLAMLEWSITEAFDAPDAVPLTAAALTDIPEARWPTLRFALSPSLRLLDLRWPVHDVWRRTQNAEELDAVKPARTLVRVWRQDFRVFHRPIEADEHAGICALATGAPFAEVCERVAPQASNDAEGAQRAFGLLSAWINDGVLAESAAE